VSKKLLIWLQIRTFSSLVYWHYGTHNWLYVVISKVQTANGLFIGELLDPKKSTVLIHA
jgi:hypothetical protein